MLPKVEANESELLHSPHKLFHLHVHNLPFLPSHNMSAMDQSLDQVSYAAPGAMPAAHASHRSLLPAPRALAEAAVAEQAVPRVPLFSAVVVVPAQL